MSWSRVEWTRLAGCYGCVALLHIAGWGMYLHYSKGYPHLVGLGLAAYLFGLRHAFDADHIAAVDDTVRYMLQQGKRPVSVGFFFSLGHSTVVLLLAVATVLSAASIKHHLPWLMQFGAVIGAGVSGTFLWIVGILNLLVLLETLQIWQRVRFGHHDHRHLEKLLTQRGLLNRLFGRRTQRFMSHSWQSYPLGILFGLGLDTASEIGLLAMTAGASAGTLPMAGALSLPILFAAGMTVMDTTDGVLMTRAYDWAFLNPLRRIFYNATMTGLSVAIALGVGTIELLKLWTASVGPRWRYFEPIVQLDLGNFGYVIVGMFLLASTISAVWWKFTDSQKNMSARLISSHSHSHSQWP